MRGGVHVEDGRGHVATPAAMAEPRARASQVFQWSCYRWVDAALLRFAQNFTGSSDQGDGSPHNCSSPSSCRTARVASALVSLRVEFKSYHFVLDLTTMDTLTKCLREFSGKRHCRLRSPWKHLTRLNRLCDGEEARRVSFHHMRQG